MAIIRTPYGDTAAPVTLSQQFMDVTTIEFDLPLTNRLVKLHAFNAWRPIAVRILDGNAHQGGSHIDRACWAVTATRQDTSVHITAYDVTKWFERRSARRVSGTSQSAGVQITDLFANVVEDREERRAFGFYNPISAADYTAHGSAWPTSPDLANATIGDIWVSGAADHYGYADSYRQAVLIMQTFSAASDPTSVKLRLLTSASFGPRWSNTVEVSADHGSTWESAHTVAAYPTLSEVWIDLTGDRSWVAADLASIQVRFTVDADADYAGAAWHINYVAIQCDFTSDVSDMWPVQLGAIDQGGNPLTLPASTLKTYRGWLDYLTSQTGMEWSVQSDFNQPGEGGLNWQPQVGAVLNATVTMKGQQRQVVSLDEGQLITKVHQAGGDGLAIYSRVRATAQGLDDVIATNAVLAADIGTHEYIDDMGSGVTVDDQTAEAAQKLKEVGSPVLHFQFDVPRTPGIWAWLEPGNTAHAWFAHAPFDPWEGTIRFVGWKIDERSGIATIDALSVQDSPGSSQAVGRGYQVQATTAARKKSPQAHRLSSIRQLFELTRRNSR